MAEIPKYQFNCKSVQLLKDQSLGIGSYGAVCKTKCDDLLCAAKIIHPTLFDPTAREHRRGLTKSGRVFTVSFTCVSQSGSTTFFTNTCIATDS